MIAVDFPQFHPLFEALGIGTAYVMYRRNRQRYGDPVSYEARWNLLAAAAVGGLLGTRLLGLAEQSPALLWDWRAWTSLGGQTIVGALLGGWIAVEITKRWLRIHAKTGDLLAVPLCLGIAVGRIGCFLAGTSDDTYGKPTTLPWGVNFGDGIPRHPTQVYEIIFLALLGWWLVRRSSRPHREGEIFELFIIAYLAWRLVIDFLKPQPLYLGMNMIQWTCLAALLVILTRRLQEQWKTRHA